MEVIYDDNDDDDDDDDHRAAVEKSHLGLEPNSTTIGIPVNLELLICVAEM